MIVLSVVKSQVFPNQLFPRSYTNVLETMSAAVIQDAIPGTIQLVDVDHSIETRHAGNGDIVLQPTPSNDPDDPLNWSPRRKLLALICPNLYMSPSEVSYAQI